MSGAPGDTRRGDGANAEARRNNPINRLVPYLDLFARLGDDELARLASVDASVVATLRRQVVEICEGLEHYIDLLHRLTDEELVRLSGASIKTIRFWRLCHPRTSARPAEPARASEAAKPDAAAKPEAAARSDAAPRSEAARASNGARASEAAPREQPAPRARRQSVTMPPQDPARAAPPPATPTPVAAWDTTSPMSGTETVLTPFGETPDFTWAALQREAAKAASEGTGPGVDPSESQQSAAQLMDFEGAPFPGYEDWRPALAGEDDDFNVDVDR